MKNRCNLLFAILIGLISVESHAGGKEGQSQDPSHPVTNTSFSFSFNFTPATRDPQNFSSSGWENQLIPMPNTDNRLHPGAESQIPPLEFGNPFQSTCPNTTYPLNEYKMPFLIRPLQRVAQEESRSQDRIQFEENQVENEEDQFSLGSKKLKKEDPSRTSILVGTQPKKDQHECNLEGCGFSFKSLKELEAHRKRLHTYICRYPKCPYTTETAQGIESHEATHALKNQPVFLCPFETCRRPYNDLDSLSSHYNGKHEDTPTPHSCPYVRRKNVGVKKDSMSCCTKEYSSGELLKEHFQTTHRLDLETYLHTNVAIYEGEEEAEFVCHLCSKEKQRVAAFMNQEKLDAHLKASHFVCPECGQEAKSLKVLNKHIGDTHTGKSQYKCVCGKSYASGGSLNRHKKDCLKAQAQSDKAGQQLAPNPNGAVE